MTTDTDRDQAIAAIKSALQSRSGKSWSVTGGRGTSWGWITIDAPPVRRTARHVLKPGQPDRSENYEYVDTGLKGGHITPADRAELAQLLGLESVHFQGVSIAASADHRREYIARARGAKPAVIAEPYWD